METEAIHFILPETSYAWFRIAYLIKYGALSESDGELSDEEISDSESSDDIRPPSPCIKRNAHSFSSVASGDSAAC